mgnify:FL=1
MRVDLFDFELPEDLIGLRPAEPRESARLLIVPTQGEFEHQHVGDLPHWLRAGDVLVVNDTRVIPARLHGIRQRGEAQARIDVTLHKRQDGSSWWAFVRPAKKLIQGEIITFAASHFDKSNPSNLLQAEVTETNQGGELLLRFNLNEVELMEALSRIGTMPLPPYIASKRQQDDQDRNDYQTLFANAPGAVAAPTAGLHFTPELISALKAKGVGIEQVTLHVGAGTFLPVKADDTDHHVMHSEFGIITADVADRLNQIHAAGGRIMAIGTTSLRILESAASKDGKIAAFSGETSIFITPGYRFRAVDMLMTNFHLPRSTLFMLVSAFAGLERMKAAYASAIERRYRFYSYGDACLLFRADPPTGQM